MNKSDLVRSIAEKTDMTLRESEAMLKAFTETVVDTVANGEKVSLVGFGSFDVVERKARTGRNPATGEKIQIKARKVPKFTAGKDFRNSVD